MNSVRYVVGGFVFLLGLWMLFASTLAGIGVHNEGSAKLGVPLAALGFAVCLGAYAIVRWLPQEAMFRQALNTLLLFGILAVVLTGVRLTYIKLTVDPSEAIVQYDETSYAYVFSFGGLCVLSLYLLNSCMRPRDGWNSRV